MANTTVACTNINLLKESQIPENPSQNELYAVEIGSIFEQIYPIGSIYITTSNTCPLQTLIGGSTWTNVGTSLLTNVTGSNSVPVKGNGKCIGLTNGTDNAGMIYTNDRTLSCHISQYGANVGTGTGSESSLPVRKTMGVTTDSTKSGIIADISGSLTKTSLTVNIFKRTA